MPPGLPVIRLHDARHTSVTPMILNNVPIPVVSEWHGHASAAFAMANYAHSQTILWPLLGRLCRRLSPLFSGPSRGVKPRDHLLL
jgi:integrase